MGKQKSSNGSFRLCGGIIATLVHGPKSVGSELCELAVEGVNHRRQEVVLLSTAPGGRQRGVSADLVFRAQHGETIIIRDRGGEEAGCYLVSIVGEAVDLQSITASNIRLVS